MKKFFSYWFRSEDTVNFRKKLFLFISPEVRLKSCLLIEIHESLVLVVVLEIAFLPIAN